MGSAISRVNGSKSVNLCKERKKLIKGVVNCRYHLVYAHVMYFQSLQNVGNAMQRFFDEDLSITVDTSSDSSVEGSHLKFHSDSDLDSSTDCVLDHSDSPGGKGDGDSFSFAVPTGSLPSDDRNAQHVDDSYVPIVDMSFYKDDSGLPAKVTMNTTKQNNGEHALSGNPCSTSPADVPHSIESHPPVNNAPPDSSQNPDTAPPHSSHNHPETEVPAWGYYNPFNHDMNNVYFYHGYYPQDDRIYHSYYLQEDRIYHSYFSQEDRFYHSYYPQDDRIYHSYYPHDDKVYHSDYPQEDGIFQGVNTDTSELRKVRKREGIPDLEYDDEQSSVEEEISKEEKSLGNLGTAANLDEHITFPQEKEMKSHPEWFGKGISKEEKPALGLGNGANLDDDVTLPQVKELKSQPDSVEKGNSKEEKPLGSLGNGANLDDDCTLPQEDETKSQPNTVEVHGERISGFNESMSAGGEHIVEGSESSEVDQLTDDVKDIQTRLREICSTFEIAFECRTEVSMLSEVGKLPYQTIQAKIKGFASCILDSLFPSRAMPTKYSAYLLSSKSSFRKMKATEVIGGDYESIICGKYHDLSSILEELRVWEKKLYKEVKMVETLRVKYDKKCRLLKTHDERGDEASKIDRTQASVKKLLPKINVSISAIEAISARIHKLRDDDLQPKVNDLIEGLGGMWMTVINCHKKQFEAIKEAKTCLHTCSVSVREDSDIKAILKLEKEILNWAAWFDVYIKTQKAFVKLLNHWLLWNLYHEGGEENAIGIDPVSPSRMGAPPIFVFCNDWCNALWSTPEDGASKAISGFASSLHRLHKMRAEERRKRTAIGYLVRNFWKKCQVSQEDNAMHLSQNALEVHPDNENVLLVGGPEGDGGGDNDGLASWREQIDDLVSQGKQINEKTTQHEESVRLVNSAALSCLTTDLFSMFEGLEVFCLELSEAYKKIRTLPNGGGKN